MQSIPHYDTATNIPSKLAKIAVRALYFEVKAYPKPGLVSFIDSGAHQDMNGDTFYRSLFSLRHYFNHITSLGLETSCFERMKAVALVAEQRMLEKTKGVNTHRGSIFALGIMCISTARLMRDSPFFTPAALHQQLLEDWKYILSSHALDAESHGSRVRKKMTIVDARGMAVSGYGVLFQLLPSFIALYQETNSIDSICLFAYLHLLIEVDDTNVLYRKGHRGLQYARKKAKDLLTVSCKQAQQQQAIALHHDFSKQGISPGGVADLMVVLLFLSQLFCEALLCHY